MVVNPINNSLIAETPARPTCGGHRASPWGIPCIPASSCQCHPSWQQRFGPQWGWERARSQIWGSRGGECCLGGEINLLPGDRCSKCWEHLGSDCSSRHFLSPCTLGESPNCPQEMSAVLERLKSTGRALCPRPPARLGCPPALGALGILGAHSCHAHQCHPAPAQGASL